LIYFVKGDSMGKYALVLIVGLLVILFVSGCIQQPVGRTNTTPADNGTEPPPTGEVKEFEMTAKQFDFQPSTITVKQGDTVKLRITSNDVAHGFAINEFGINERIEPEQTVNIKFVADKKGTFRFYCSVFCGNGHGTMEGQLIVE
jgi:cytochrome c oxidase subunit 2